ncbi:MAG: hypothetical protein PHF60_00720 [Candidatus ainarchaeum sp.]|nr:hypothetical protein [Candidatus ainarchaeum sp.]
MNLQHTKPRTPVERTKTAAKVFATAALLTGTLFGCDAEKSKTIDAPLPSPMENVQNKALAVKCAPCQDCTVPEGASLLKEGSIIGTTKQVPSVLVLRGIDQSTVEARYESITANIPHGETQNFSVGPGVLCTVTVSGKEIYDVFKPGAFLTAPGWVSLSSKRTKLYGLYVESQK